MGKLKRIDEFEHFGTEFDENKYKYLDIETNKLVACKRLTLRRPPPKASHPDCVATETGVPCKAIREVSLLKAMEHENIARLRRIEYDRAERFALLVFEYPGMDLKKFLRTEPEKARDPKLMKSLFYQLLCGISYHHSIEAAHGNLNHKNVLIDCINNTLKITHLLLKISDYITYKAPELFLGAAELSLPADMFSIGCIFAEMVTRKPLFTHPGNGREIDSIFSLLGTPTEKNWPDASQLYKQLSHYDKIEPADLSEKFPSLDEDGVDLLSKLLCLDPSKRIKAIDALEHIFFKDVED